jgi:DNA polymerase epsilon subunit 1
MEGNVSIFVTSKKLKEEVNHLNKLWRDTQEEEEEDTIIKLNLISSKKEGFLELKKCITHSKKGPTIILLQSSISNYEWMNEIPEFNDIPLLNIPYNTEDDVLLQPLYTKSSSSSIKRMFIRYHQSKEWYLHLIPFTQQFNVPIGNVENDFTIYLMDVLFSRVLRESNHLLWIGDEEEEEEEEEELFSSVLHSGGYFNVSCEMEMKHLLMNAILQHGHLEKEEEEMKLNASTMDLKYSNAFQILQRFISSLYYECGMNNSKENGVLIDNLYRWIIHRKSKVYDEKFSHFILKIMRKFWLYLLSNIKKLGCKIIHSNFNKLIISTPKNTIQDTKNYLTYLFENISKKKLFSWIEFEPIRYWEYVVYLDAMNYFGIKSGDTSSIVIHLNMIESLNFKDHLRFYLTKYLRDTFQKDEDYLKRYITNHFTGILLSFIEQFKNTSEEIHFIKLISHLLSFDERIKSEVEHMRVECLKLTKQEEEEGEMDFKKEGFILNNFICSFCNSCKNLDILRDPTILDYKCSDCSTSYDKDIMEGKLIELLNKRIHSYQHQDLECKKCHQIKYQFMTKNCECSGEWMCQQKENLNIFKKIAKFHQFELLSELLK